MSGTAVNSRPNELQSIVTQLLQAERKVAPSFKFEKFIQLHAFFDLILKNIFSEVSKRTWFAQIFHSLPSQSEIVS